MDIYQDPDQMPAPAMLTQRELVELINKASARIAASQQQASYIYVGPGELLPEEGGTYRYVTTKGIVYTGLVAEVSDGITPNRNGRVYPKGEITNLNFTITSGFHQLSTDDQSQPNP
jgi:hypothetical protein